MGVSTTYERPPGLLKHSIASAKGSSSKPTVHKKSVVKSSSGDELGAAKGVVSSKIKSECKRTQGVSKIKVEKKPVVTAMQSTSHNKNNAPPGTQVAPSQTKVIVTSM